MREDADWLAETQRQESIRARTHTTPGFPTEWIIAFDSPFSDFIPFLDYTLAGMRTQISVPAKKEPNTRGYQYTIDHPSGLLIGYFTAEPRDNTTSLCSSYMSCSVPTYYDDFFATFFRQIATVPIVGDAPAWFTPYVPVKLATKTPSTPHRRQPRAGTKDKILRIAEERRHYIAEYGRVPNRSLTIRSMNSDESTVKTHAPTLYDRWDEITYIWNEDDWSASDQLEEDNL